MLNEFFGKKLLLLGGIKTECDIVRHAQAMGVYVIVADSNPNAPACLIADEYVNISATDVDAIVKYCQENNIDGITTGFVDILMHPCYEACKQLRLPYYATEKMLKMSTDKVDFKKTCCEYGVPVPKTYFVGHEINEELLNTITYPVFIKPLDASGSRGAGVCNNEDELKVQFNEALQFSPSCNVIIEEYIKGTEFLLDYIGVNGEFRLLSMFDRYMSDDRGSAINYSNVSMCPSKNINQYYEYINNSVVQMFKKLGFTDGLIFMQGYCNGNEIIFYEMGCRLGGSFFNLENEILGVDPVDMTIRYALSGRMLENIEKVDIRSADFNRCAMVCNYILAEGEDTIYEIKGIDDIKKMDSYVALIQHRDIGCFFKKDSIVDKPVLSFFMITENLNKAKEDLAYMNCIVQVVNKEGKSLLAKKYNPEKL